LPQLVGLKFENITELDFREYSFNATRIQPAIRLEIIDSNVPLLPSHLLKGNLEELIITNSNITKINAFAFTGYFNEISKISFSSSTIGEIEPQAFKKLTVRKLELINTTFQMNSVSRTFYDCIIHDISIENSHFTMLNPSTFDIKEVQRMMILNSTFGTIEGEAFMMDVSDIAIFSRNNVTTLHHAAFKGLTMHPKTPTTRTRDVYFEFVDNSITSVNPKEDILFSPDLRLEVRNIYIGDPRSCEVLSGIYDLKFFKENANSVYMRTDVTFEKLSYLHDHCRLDSNWLWILLISLAVVVVILLILIPVICCYLKNKRQHKIMILPEPRTYKQTQIVMQVETHGLIKTDF